MRPAGLTIPDRKYPNNKTSTQKKPQTKTTEYRYGNNLLFE